MRNSKKRFIIRKKRVRNKISKISNRVRLTIFKSGKHIYAQIINDDISQTLVAASTLDETIRISNKSNCNKLNAEKVGILIAQRANTKGIKKIVFDKGGYKYHGVIKSLADGARSILEF